MLFVHVCISIEETFHRPTLIERLLVCLRRVPYLFFMFVLRVTSWIAFTRKPENRSSPIWRNSTSHFQAYAFVVLSCLVHSVRDLGWIGIELDSEVELGPWSKPSSLSPCRLDIRNLKFCSPSSMNASRCISFHGRALLLKKDPRKVGILRFVQMRNGERESQQGILKMVRLCKLRVEEPWIKINKYYLWHKIETNYQKMKRNQQHGRTTRTSYTFQ